MSQRIPLSYALPAILISTLLVAAIIWAWTEPTVAPPGDNVPAPINVGASTQLKSGSLVIGGLALEAYNNAYLATLGGNVGIGTATPGSTLTVRRPSAGTAFTVRNTGDTADTFTISDTGSAYMSGFQLGTSATAGHILTVNASGVGTWQAPTGGGGGIGGTISVGQVAFGAATNTISGDNSLWWDNTNKRLGIGIASPSVKLEVAGQVKITGGNPGAGKVLTSDATGLASWETPTGGGGGGMLVSPVYVPSYCEDTDTTVASCTVTCPPEYPVRLSCGTYGCSTGDRTRAHGVYPYGNNRCSCNVWGPTGVQVTVRCYAVCATTTTP